MSEIAACYCIWCGKGYPGAEGRPPAVICLKCEADFAESYRDLVRMVGRQVARENRPPKIGH